MVVWTLTLSNVISPRLSFLYHNTQNRHQPSERSRQFFFKLSSRSLHPQRQLGPLLYLSKCGHHHPRRFRVPPNANPILCQGKLKFVNNLHDKSLYFTHAADKGEATWNVRRNQTYANRQPIQDWGPPINVNLNKHVAGERLYRKPGWQSLQVAVHPQRNFSITLNIAIQSSLRIECMGVRPENILVPIVTSDGGNDVRSFGYG